MMPSPAERTYLDQQRWLEEANASASIAAAAASTAAGHLTAQQTRIGVVSREARVDYEETTFDLGSGRVAGSGWTLVEIPGFYGNALSLILTIQTTKIAFPEIDPARIRSTKLRWVAVTYMNRDNWISLVPPGGTAVRTLEVDKADYAGLRIHGPFASHLGLNLAAIAEIAEGIGSWSGKDEQRTATYTGLKVSLGVQRA